MALFALASTPTTPATGSRVLNPEPINFNADWRVVDEKPGEITLTHLGSELSRPTSLRIAMTPIPDMFKGTTIAPPGPAVDGSMPTKAGVSVLCQLNTTMQSDDGVTYPATAHIVLKLPVYPNPNGSDGSMQGLIEALLGTLYDTKDTSMNTRLDALVRGAVTPIDL